MKGCNPMKRLIGFLSLALVALTMTGCASYSGGRVVDGTNLEIGMTVPGTEWSINFLSYTGGVVVKGNDQTQIFVTNTVAETNSYFGVVRTQRNSTLVATIIPVESSSDVKDTDSKPSPSPAPDDADAAPPLGGSDAGCGCLSDDLCAEGCRCGGECPCGDKCRCGDSCPCGEGCACSRPCACASP